jgi:hypothetical protein
VASTLLNRRSRQRLKLPYSIVLYRLGDSRGIRTTTQDISSDGFYCVSEQPFSPSEKLECEVVIPSQVLGVSNGENLVLRCRAEVVRVIADGLRPGYGLACHVEDFAIRRLSLGQNLVGAGPQFQDA